MYVVSKEGEGGEKRREKEEREQKGEDGEEWKGDCGVSSLSTDVSRAGCGWRGRGRGCATLGDGIGGTGAVNWTRCRR